MAATGTEDTQEAGAAEAAPSGGGGGGGSKLVIILTLVNVLATLAMVGILMVSFQKEKKTASVEDIAVHGEEAGKEGKEGEHGGGHGAPEHGGGHGEGEKAKAGDKKKNAEFGKMVTLDQFTVNLSTPGSSGAKFVRVNVSLEVPNEESESEINHKIPQVRNVIIDLFNSKRPADLATAEGRDYLKEEIRNAINGFLVNGKVKGVFFTSFNLSS